VDLAIASQGGGAPRPLGSALLTGGSAFATVVVIPVDLTDGTYVITAALAGEVLATAGIRVVESGGTVPPTLEAVDPVTNLPVQSLVEGESFTLRGAGFQPGPVEITVDTSGGQALGTATAGAGGSFQSAVTWPVGVLLMHKAVAMQSTGATPLEAEVALFVQPIPR
jgi:hypothetical protein